MKTLFIASALCLISLCSNAQVDVYDYEKLGSPYYLCTVYVQTKNNTSKMLAIEHKNGIATFTKEEAKEWIQAVETAISIKTFENSEGKKEVFITLPKGNSALINGKREVSVFFDRYPVNSVVTIDSFGKMNELIKKAYEKL